MSRIGLPHAHGKNYARDVILHGDRSMPVPRVYIPLEVLQKIRAYVALCPVEINGFGIVKRSGNDFIVTDAFILSQSVTSVTAEVDMEGHHAFLYDLISSGGDPATIRLQWHSHVEMDAYCSGTDMATIERSRADYMISLVLNKQGEQYCRLDVFTPVRLGYAVNLEVVIPDAPASMYDACKAEIAEKVKVKNLFDDLGEDLLLLPGSIAEMISQLSAGPPLTDEQIEKVKEG